MSLEQERLTRRELLATYAGFAVPAAVGTGICYGSDRAQVHFKREADRFNSRLPTGPRIGMVNWNEIYETTMDLTRTVGRWGQVLGGLGALVTFWESRVLSEPEAAEATEEETKPQSLNLGSETDIISS